MRLVIDGHRLAARRTGVGRCLAGLLAEWAESGWPLDEVLLVVRDPAGLERVPSAIEPATRVVGSSWPGVVWENLGLGRLLGRDDVLLAPANLVPMIWGGPTVLIVYDTLLWSAPRSFPWHVRWRFGWRYRQSARKATRVIVPSQATAADVTRVFRLPAERIRVVYPGPEPWFTPLPRDAPQIREARHVVGAGEAPYFLFVGKRSRRRHVPAILAAFAAHRARWPDHRLLFVGPGSGEPLPGPMAGVIDAGHVSEPVLHGLLASALGLIYPSDHEGFGLPVVEALACGCPVVTSPNSALLESGGDAVLYLDAAEPPAIGRAMERLATDPAFRADLVARGRAHVARFSRSAFAEGVRQEIQRVAGGCS